MVKIICLVHVLLNGTNDFRKQGSVKSDDRPGRPHTSVTANNIEKVRDVIRKDHGLGVRALAQTVNLDRESV
jgi:hypothetical protein